MMDTPEKDVIKKKAKNKSQNVRILEIFRSNPSDWMTPWQVNRILGWPEKQITSTRRAITDLTRDELLIKSNETRKEQEGTLNALYKLART